MNRIIYGAPPSNTPSGGVKVIYRHSEILSANGIDSCIWHPGDENFKCNWFENSVKTIGLEKLSPLTDLIVLPEIWASAYVPFLKNLGFKVAIFVQNCYYTHVNLNPTNPNGVLDAYNDADFILSISNDTTEYLMSIFKMPTEKIILQRYSVDEYIFYPRKKSKTITFMPRKMEQHSTRVVSALAQLLPSEWEIKALDKMSEKEIAKNLGESIIFLAFSEFEGLPVPPVEAAMSGNIVIGYHGQGGREYWNKPIFVDIEQGDIQRFVSTTLSKINQFANKEYDLYEINDSIKILSNYFSRNNELAMLGNLVSQVEKL